ncbi:MAG: NADH-quinone oxidoreductase subunit C [Kosmotogaceae bacterium]
MDTERLDTIYKAIESEKVEILSEKEKRVYFEVEPGSIKKVAGKLHEIGLRLSTMSAIENKDSFEIIYHFSDDFTGYYFCPKVFVQLKKPEIPSVASEIKGALWIEREIHELFGVNFKGHPNLKPLLKENIDTLPDTPLRVKRRFDDE